MVVRDGHGDGGGVEAAGGGSQQVPCMGGRRAEKEWGKKNQWYALFLVCME